MQNCPSLIGFASMTGFFSKKQYAAIADNELAMKLLKERCPEWTAMLVVFDI